MDRQTNGSPSGRQGAILVFVVLLVGIIVGCVAFACDIAYMQVVKTELKSTADFSARAAGEAMTRTQSLDEAKVSAREIARKNSVAGEPLLLADEDIIPGHSAISESTGRWGFVANEEPYNSIRVVGRRTVGSPSGSVPLFFAPIFGQDFFEVQQQATVVRLDRDVILTVDRSSSMKLPINHPTGNMSTSDPRFPQPPLADSRWIALESAVQTFVEALEETEQVEWVGLVSYASNYSRFGVNNQEVEVNQTLTESHSLINSEMATISGTVFNGLTHISAGLDQATDVLFDDQVARPFASKTIVLMTDGIPNPGTPQQVRDRAQAAADLDVRIHTVTFGTAADQSLMQDVAQIGGGQHYHAADTEELNAIFREIALTIPLVFVD